MKHYKPILNTEIFSIVRETTNLTLEKTSYTFEAMTEVPSGVTPVTNKAIADFVRY